MLSYTLLGRTVITMPFIVYTSLGREIAHNWWGNSVFVDQKKGIGVRALQHVEEVKKYRMGLCRKYTNHVNHARRTIFRGKTPLFTSLSNLISSNFSITCEACLWLSIPKKLRFYFASQNLLLNARNTLIVNLSNEIFI